MTVPSVETSSVELMLLVGRAVFLVFSFILATIAFVRWRRTTLAQTEIVLANHTVLLRRLADLEARVDATNVTVSQLLERIRKPQPVASPTPVATHPAASRWTPPRRTPDSGRCHPEGYRPR